MKKLLLVGGVLLAAAAAILLWITQPWGNGPKGLRLPGVVEIQDVRLGSKIGGRVAEVLAREGEVVSAGQELVRFEAPELEAQRDQVYQKLNAAIADRKKADAGPRPQEIDEARAQYEAAEARRQRVEAGWREEEKRQARKELEAAQADLDFYRSEYERVMEVTKKTPLTRTEIDKARTDRDRALKRNDAALARSEMLERGSRSEDIAEAIAERDRARARYDLLKAGTRPEEKELARAQVSELEARLRELEAQLREAVVRAPEKAVLEVLAVRKGDLVPANQPVARVLRADDLWVRVYVPATELEKVTLGQKVEVTTDASPNVRHEGVVMQIATISEFTPRNVQSVDERRHQVFGIKVRVEDPKGIFKSGMAAEVFIPEGGH